MLGQSGWAVQPPAPRRANVPIRRGAPAKQPVEQRLAYRHRDARLGEKAGGELLDFGVEPGLHGFEHALGQAVESANAQYPRWPQRSSEHSAPGGKMSDLTQEHQHG